MKGNYRQLEGAVRITVCALSNLPGRRFGNGRLRSFAIAAGRAGSTAFETRRPLSLELAGVRDGASGDVTRL